MVCVRPIPSAWRPSPELHTARVTCQVSAHFPVKRYPAHVYRAQRHQIRRQKSVDTSTHRVHLQVDLILAFFYVVVLRESELTLVAT